MICSLFSLSQHVLPIGSWLIRFGLLIETHSDLKISDTITKGVVKYGVISGNE